MKNERIAIRLEKKTKNKLQDVSAKNKRKLSDQARIYIEDGLEKNK